MTITQMSKMIRILTMWSKGQSLFAEINQDDFKFHRFNSDPQYRRECLESMIAGLREPHWEKPGLGLSCVKAKFDGAEQIYRAADVIQRHEHGVD